MKYDIYLMYIVLRLLGKITDFHVAAVRPSSCPPCPPARVPRARGLSPAEAGSRDSNSRYFRTARPWSAPRHPRPG